MLKFSSKRERSERVVYFCQCFVCLRIIKHGDPVGDQRIGFVLLYLFE